MLKKGKGAYQTPSNISQESSIKTFTNVKVAECPECGSSRVVKDGTRLLKRKKELQRFLCKNCGVRFSNRHNNSKCDNNKKGSGKSADSSNPKNLPGLLTALKLEEKGKTTSAGTTNEGQIGLFLWDLQKQGLEKSVSTYNAYLGVLKNAGANLQNPESVKEIIAQKQYWNPNTKALAIAAYTKFLKFLGRSWNPPKCERIEKLIRVPKEREIDALIAGSRSKKQATFLQLLKETGLRSGEAWSLEWKDIDFSNRTIPFDKPQKHGKPRMLKISPKLTAMLKRLQGDSPKIFTGKVEYFRQNYLKFRKRLANKLEEPNLRDVNLHKFRHYFGSKFLRKNNGNLALTAEKLGHRSILSTAKYIHSLNLEVDEYEIATATPPEEAQEYAKAGYELFDTIKDVHVYRRPKL